MPHFEYADLVWGDKHNITLMSSLQVLQNKAAKVILRTFAPKSSYGEIFFISPLELVHKVLTPKMKKVE